MLSFVSEFFCTFFNLPLLKFRIHFVLDLKEALTVKGIIPKSHGVRMFVLQVPATQLALVEE